MWSTYVSWIRSVASTEKDKSVRKINTGIPAGCRGNLLRNISVSIELKYDEIAISPTNSKPVKNFLDWELAVILFGLATGFTAGFSKVTA